MLEIPRFLSLSAQASAALRKGIDDGVWKEFLPSGRRLREIFQVSRPTLRTALHQLAKDGLINIRQNALPAVLPRWGAIVDVRVDAIILSQ